MDLKPLEIADSFNPSLLRLRVAGSASTIGDINPSSHIEDDLKLAKISQDVNSSFHLALNDHARATIAKVLGKHHAPGAVFGAQNDSPCMQGTRIQFLADILADLKTCSGSRLVWVAGTTGTGKTSIALTICQKLVDDNSVYLGGAFFCSRSAGAVERSDVRRIIPTLATTFSHHSPGYASALAKQLDATPDISHISVRTQVEVLLRQPLEKLAPLVGHVVFVIDALDECNDAGRLKELLDALADFAEDLPVKFLLTSRLEMNIRGCSIGDRSLSPIIHLHTIDPAHAMEDIQLYISTSLEQLSPSTSWYTVGDVNALVQLSAGLFIFAATVMKYIGAQGTIKGHQDRLRKATSAIEANTYAVAPVDNIYEFIVTEACGSSSEDSEELIVTQNALACILTLRASISVGALAELIGIDVQGFRRRLDRLHSVVYLPPDNATTGVRILHASFGDYLLDRAPSYMRIAPSLGDVILADGCLQVMARRLHFNVSESCSSHKPNSPAQSANVALPLEYACLQWIYHVSKLPEPTALDERIAREFRPYFLFWLEILSVLGQVRRAAAMLIFAAATVSDVLLQIIMVSFIPTGSVSRARSLSSRRQCLRRIFP